ncbi:MAG: hypothetical protein ACI9FR_001428 [Cryomorphaceae bacterium]|jgi:hypothetical protein
MNPRFDHIVILVPCLKVACKQFSELGFKVTLGGSHGVTHNAMIIFADKTYIELITYKNPLARLLISAVGFFSKLPNSAGSTPKVKQRFFKWFSKEFGPVDWCLRVEDMLQTLATLADQEVDVFQSQAFHRIRPDGVKVEWHLGGFDDFDLPFLLYDETPYRARVPYDASLKHANGAIGIQCLKLKPCNHSHAIKQLSLLLGQAPLKDHNGSRFDVGANAITLNSAKDSTPSYVVELAYLGSEKKHLDIAKASATHIWLVPQTDNPSAKLSPPQELSR